jgi:predicted DCC family thiol-disulfide oxidoreductase YuxK
MSVPTVLYDGTCRFCLAQANRLRRFTGGRVAFENSYAPGVPERFPMLPPFSLEHKLGEMKFVDTDGQLHGGAAAVSGALIAAGGPLGWLAYSYRFPPIRIVADWGYKQISRRRYKIAGQCDETTCQ